MTVWIALLRGLNLGKRTIPMPALRDLVEGAGGEQVATYIQSGNVVFAHRARSAEKLSEDLERRLEDATGLDIPVLLRTKAQLHAAVAANPYAVDDPTKVHVLFLEGQPAKGALDAIDVSAFAPEELTLLGQEIYYHLPAGMGRAQLPAAVAKLRDPAIRNASARNWRTVTVLDEMATRIA
jgi:uncharacterized protein (DUF1697 family)